MFKLVSLGLVIVFVAFVMNQPNKTIDDHNYSAAPPMFVFRHVLPFIQRVKRFVEELSPPIFQIFEELSFVQVANMLVVVAKRDIPDLLLEGPRSVLDLSKASKSHPEILYRILRRLASVGYFRELPTTNNEAGLLHHRFENTPKSYALSRAAKVGFRAMLMHQMFDIIPCYANMEKLLDEAPGEEKINLFNAHHKVENMWEYFVNERGSNFNKAMEDLDGIGGDVAAQDVPWEERCSVVIDVGGGKGRYLASILKYATKIDGVLFDLPYAIGEAKTAWPQVYPESLNRRVSFAAGSFFNASDIPNPPGGPRCYVLRVVLHDWDDAHCVQILSNIAKRVRPGDSVVIVESIPEEFGNLPSVTTMDIVMATFRGKERTREALDQLFVKSGLDPSNVLLHTRSLFRVAVSTKKQ